MELIGIWLEVVANFITTLMHGFIYWLGEFWHLNVTLFSKFILLVVSVCNWIFHLIDNNTFNKWAKAIGNGVFLVFIAIFVTWRLEKEKQKQQQEDRCQGALSDYLKQMTRLLVDKELSTKDHQNPIVQAAKALTVTTIRELDSGRNQLLTNFLVEANLIQPSKLGTYKSLPSLLKGANLEDANLESVNLEDANLEAANLNGANLNDANLIRTILIYAKLNGADLNDANLNSANLNGAMLKSAKLNRTSLIRANLNGANLESANLKGAYLYDANLNGANLRDANLYGAILIRAKLNNDTSLYGANLNDTYLKGINFQGIRLYGTKVKKAKFGNNQGIDEAMKADLINRGAVFE